MKLIDQMPIPTFVTDPNARVVYCNTAGQVLYDLARPHNIENNIQRRNWNFLDLVYPEKKKSIEEIISRATKEKVDPIEVPILGMNKHIVSNLQKVAPQNNIHEEEKIQQNGKKNQLGLNPAIIEQGIFIMPNKNKGINIIKYVLKE